MNATFTLDDAGQINLPEALKLVFGAAPGVQVRAEVTADRIEIVKVLPEVTEGILKDGVLMLPQLGINTNTAAAVRAEREAQAGRAFRRRALLDSSVPDEARHTEASRFCCKAATPSISMQF